MRLLNAKTQGFEEFDNDKPKYAILSHRWARDSKEEVLLHEFGLPEATTKSGYRKIRGTCDEALRRRIEYVWVDTCCIDKTNNTELAEAINSMFRWYEEAEICFAYLEDVPSGEDVTSTDLSIARSQWFTRGWTLQELLAPRRLEYFTEDWESLGDRNTRAVQVSDVTGIHEVYLTTWIDSTNPRFDVLRGASVSERMSWAARRQTTKEEDRAYCLMGIFGINMPLTYGEGMNAFFRLQQEIMQRSFDPTLLAWNASSYGRPLQPDPPELYSPWKLALNMLAGNDHLRSWWSMYRPYPTAASVAILALTPESFESCANYVPHPVTFDWSFTNEGISASLPVSEDDLFPYMALPCGLRENPSVLLALPLERHKSGRYVRACLPVKLVDHRVWHLWPTTKIQLITKPREKGGAFDGPSPPLLIRRIPANIRLLRIYATDNWVLGHRSTTIRTTLYSTCYRALLLLQIEGTVQLFTLLIIGNGLRTPECFFLQLASGTEPPSQLQVECLFNHLLRGAGLWMPWQLPTTIVHAIVLKQQLLGRDVFVVDICELSRQRARMGSCRRALVGSLFPNFLISGFHDCITITKGVFIGLFLVLLLWLIGSHISMTIQISLQKFESVNDLMSFLLEGRDLFLSSIPIMLATLWSVPAVSFFLPTYSWLLRQNRRVIGVISALVAGYLFSLFVRRSCALWATGLCEQLVLDSLYMFLLDVFYAKLYAVLYGFQYWSEPIFGHVYPNLALVFCNSFELFHRTLLRSITRPSAEG
jgi:hypothetical protein